MTQVPIRRDNNSNMNQRPMRSLSRRGDLLNDFFSPWFGSAWLSPGVSSWLSPMEDLFSMPTFNLSGTSDFFTPACDLEETDSEYLLNFDLPGVNREDVKVEVRNGQLVVSGERREEREEEGERRGRTFRERTYGYFERRMSLPSNIDNEAIHANFENGVLSVMIPKMEEARPRQIEVGQGRGSSQESRGQRQGQGARGQSRSGRSSLSEMRGRRDEGRQQEERRR